MYMYHHPRAILGAMAAALTLVAGNAAAALTYRLHTGYSSEYLWRGLDLGADLIEAGLDVSTEYQGLGLSAGAWYGNFENAGQNLDELDLYGEVSKDFGLVKGSIGYIAYLYPNSDTDTYQEIYFGVSRDFGLVAASLKYYWGVQGDNNGYTEFALTRSFELSPGLTLNLESNLGYLVEQGQATAWTNKVSLDWGFVEHAKLAPFVALSLPLGDDVNTPYFHSGNELVGGCLLSVSF